MAEAALIGIAKSVLKLIASPAMDELKLLWNQKTQLENLENTITTISNVLQDAERQKPSSKAVRVWLERLKAALYDADDFFDTISIKAVQNKAKYGSGLYNFAFMVKSAHKVKGLRNRIDAIAKDIRDFNFLTNVIERDRSRRESTHSYFPSDEVVGREEEREAIVEMLLAPRTEQKGVFVIAVIGIGGMGKTTVGQLVYGDNRIQGGFDLHMWACINDFSCLDQVMLSLLKSLNKHNLETLATENLQLKLREEIERKRFLLVLDDVWDEDPLNWSKLKILLDSGNQGSVVLATTRSVKVAQSMLAVEPYYQLEGISDESAQTLFNKIAFEGRQQHNNTIFEGLGKKIVKKCANIPLLIVTIASFLRHQNQSKWHSLVDGEFPTVVGGDYTKVMEALKISYREFPYPEKRCFAICSLFPKDYDFCEYELIRLWIAEGFVEGDDEFQSLEDRAEEHFLYLVGMGFFHKVDGCFKMHDLVHDLAKEVAGSESFSIDGTSSKNPIKIWDKARRHVSLIGYDWPSFPHSKCKVRTFLMFDKDRYGAATFFNKVMLNCKALRVLDISYLGMKEVPESIGKLTHLRFLDLSYNFMERLPNSICNLHHLQYLNLQGCRALKELPDEIGGLVSMRRLQLPREHLSEMPAALAAMTSLVTLDKQVLLHKHGGELRYLERLNNLSGSLSILIQTGWEDVIKDAKSAKLFMKSRLKEIKFIFVELESGKQVEALMVALKPHPNLEHLEIGLFGGSKLPQWISSLNRLVSIELGDSKVVELPSLSHIQSLKKLSLRNMYSMLAVESNRSYDTGFAFLPSLETLELSYLPNLRGWWVQRPTTLPTFPHVTNLSISGCRKLEFGCMPLFEPTLEVLDLWGADEVRFGIVNQCSSALRELRISDVTRAIFEGFKSLTSLEKLGVNGFANDGVEEGEVTPWEFLQRLHTLNLTFGEFCGSTKGIVDGVKHLTNSLIRLSLCECRDLYLPWTLL